MSSRPPCLLLFILLLLYQFHYNIGLSFCK
nr:MAG TPA: hypothetical protein [Caudoviricetes sp.]